MKPKDLEAIDLVTLSRYDKETGKIDFRDASILEIPVSRNRLVNAGIAEENGRLTEKGVELAKKVCETEKKLQAGVPFETRKRQNPQAMVEESGLAWYQATVKTKPVCSNGEILFFGKPERGMSTLKMGANFVKQNIKKCTVGVFKEVFPQKYKISNLGGLEWVILANAEGGPVAAIQAKYFDFVRHRFPKGQFFARNESTAVQVRVQNMGLKDDVIACIMPCTGVIGSPQNEVVSGAVPET